MRYSRFFLPTLKEVPKEAEIPSHRLMLRAGMIRKLSSGIYEWLPMGLRVLRKAEGIVRREMDRIGGQEVLLPALQPCSLWDETGRWGLYGKELFRLKDRKESDFCLGPTHEEVVTDLVRRFLRSWKEMPLLLYQIQTKFRDEIRPRFGILRGREFLMKDAYSFDRDEEDAGKSYWRAYEAYSRICRACGLDFRAVEASTGLIGGRFSHEFMILASTGEEEIAVCSCGYAANLEKVEFSPVLPDYSGETAQSPEEVSTPGKKTVEEVSQFLGAEKGRFIKTLVYRKAKELFLVLIPGDREVNSKKLEEFVQGEAVLADEAAIFELTGAPSGFAGPVGLKKKAKIIADESIAGMRNAVSGANKKDFHLKNINAGRDFQPDVTLNIIRPAKGDRCLKCGGGIELMRGIEIGHTFKLGTKYSVPMNLKYRDQAGAENPVVMGCYGIGVSRLVAAAIEQCHDEKGIVWPIALAPFSVEIVALNYQDDDMKKTADRLYEEFSKEFEVLLDDREVSPGVKFNDADLIGVPWQIVLGKKVREGKADLGDRKTGMKTEYRLEEITGIIRDKLIRNGESSPDRA